MTNKSSPQFATHGRTYWMHTIDGRPAGFDGRQICYWWTRAPLAASLKQIREERLKCEAWRMKRGFDFNPKDYGHITVRIP